MAYTVAQKILAAHLVDGTLGAGGELGLRIDRTLTQDSTGTMAYLQFEAMGIPRVKTDFSIAFVDHNMLQCGFENADDHEYIRTVTRKSGVHFSRPGNGICHRVMLERFAVPGATLIGSDSHTPTAGGLGMLSFGAGGLDVAVAMGGGAYYINDPRLMQVNLTGSLPDAVSAKDVALEILRRIGVKGGVGKILEFTGEGIANLSVPERATITNLCTEVGATTSVFPSDERTLAFLKAQNREADYKPLAADEGAVYHERLDIDMSTLVPLAACPHMPDIVKPVSELAGMAVQQVCIGSCTNSSILDLKRAAAILKGHVIAPGVSLTVSPGSRQVLSMLAADGTLGIFLAAGARILECGCGPCIGMGQSPASGAVSLRTFNRNFEGRSGTRDAQVYLVSPETAAASAINGIFADPREYAEKLTALDIPAQYAVDDSMVDAPLSLDEAAAAEVRRGPNIKPFPLGKAPGESFCVPCSLKVGDNITTDHISPAGAKLLPYRSNIPFLSDYCFTVCDESFPARAKQMGESVIVGGENYGQGSSREHAALVPLYLGIRAVLAKSFARIHRDNLVNSGILPLTFENPADYDRIGEGDEICISGIAEALENSCRFTVQNRTTGAVFTAVTDLPPRRRAILAAGGLIPYTKERA